MNASDSLFALALQGAKGAAALLVIVGLFVAGWHMITILQIIAASLEYLRDKARAARDWQSSNAYIAKRERVKP